MKPFWISEHCLKKNKKQLTWPKFIKLHSVSTQKPTDSVVTQCPQLTGYKSVSERSCHGGKPLSFSIPTSSSGSLLFLTAFFFDSTKYVDALPPPFFFLHYFFVSSHSSSLLPCSAPGIMTMEILFWESVSPWLVEKWLKSAAQTQYIIGVEMAHWQCFKPGCWPECCTAL